MTYLCQHATYNVDMQHKYVKMQDNYVNMRLEFCCMSAHVIINKLRDNIIILHVKIIYLAFRGHI